MLYNLHCFIIFVLFLVAHFSDIPDKQKRKKKDKQLNKTKLIVLLYFVVIFYQLRLLNKDRKNRASISADIATEIKCTGPEVIIFLHANSAKHEFFFLINVTMPTSVDILTFMSRKNNILGLSEPDKSFMS